MERSGKYDLWQNFSTLLIFSKLPDYYIFYQENEYQHFVVYFSTVTGGSLWLSKPIIITSAKVPVIVYEACIKAVTSYILKHNRRISLQKIFKYCQRACTCKHHSIVSVSMIDHACQRLAHTFLSPLSVHWKMVTRFKLCGCTSQYFSTIFNDRNILNDFLFEALSKDVFSPRWEVFPVTVTSHRK